jgi:tetratricopeptide (TPR) repeat protein
MDCRNALIVAIILASGVVGCTTLGGPSNSLPPPTPAFPFDDKDLKGDHKPKAATLIAYGNFHAQAARELARSQAERDNYYDMARKSYQQALELEPKNLAALTALARLYVAMDDREHAVKTYEHALQIAPREASICYELGMYFARHKEWQPALQYIKSATQLDPENRLFARSLGFCEARTGDYEDGFAVLAKVDGEAVAHYSIARMLRHVNEEALCREHLQMALRLQPDLAAAREMLAELDGIKPDYAGLSRPAGNSPLRQVSEQPTPTTPAKLSTSRLPSPKEQLESDDELDGLEEPAASAAPGASTAKTASANLKPKADTQK